MRLDWLESFVAFCEAKNFTHAARKLHISQPALHVQIRRLGESVGAPLYRRDGRKLELTPQGEALEIFARDLADRVVGFTSELRETEDDR